MKTLYSYSKNPLVLREVPSTIGTEELTRKGPGDSDEIILSML